MVRLTVARAEGRDRCWSRLGATALALVLASSPSLGPAQDWGETTHQERREEIIERYLSILERAPRAGHVLDRLLGETGRGATLQRVIDRYRRELASMAEDAAERANLATLLGHLLAAGGEAEDALRAFDEALAHTPSFEFALRGKADLLASLERWEEARGVYELALATASSQQDRAEVLSRLADLSMDARDWGSASGYVEQLIALSPGDPYLRMELAQLYLEHDRMPEALAQYRAIADGAGTDMRRRAVAERDMAAVLARMGEFDEARSVYERAYARVTPDYWLAREIERALYELHLASNRRAEFVERYERRWRPLNGRQWNLLASVYQELGRTVEAIDALRRASRADRGDSSALLALIRLLRSHRLSEHLDEVISLYETAVQRAPYDSALRLEFIEFLWAEAGRDAARRALAAAERAFRGSPDVLVTIADRYHRYGALDDAERLLTRIARQHPREPRFQVALGDFYFAEAKRSRAESIWLRVLPLYPTHEEGLAAVGDIYGNHGLIEEAIDYYERAADGDPVNVTFRRRLAQLYERARRSDNAARLYAEIYEKATDDALLREAGDSLIRIYDSLGFLEQGVDSWQAFASADADGRWALLLGRAYVQLGEAERAQRTLQTAIARHGVSVPLLRQLASAERAGGDLVAATETLQRIATIDPAGNRWVWDELIDLALRQFADEQALAYASDAVTENPHDGAAHARLGELERSLGHIDRAIRAYREAVDVNPRVAEYQLALGELLVTDGQLEPALDVYLRVASESSDEASLLRAGRRAMVLAIAARNVRPLVSVLESRLARASNTSALLKLELELFRQVIELDPAFAQLVDVGQFNVLIRRALSDADASVLDLAIQLAERRPSPALADALMRAAVKHAEPRDRLLGLIDRIGGARVSGGLLAIMPEMSSEAQHLVARIALKSDTSAGWRELSEPTRQAIAKMARRDAYSLAWLDAMSPTESLAIAESPVAAESAMQRTVGWLIRWRERPAERERLWEQMAYHAREAALVGLRCVGLYADVSGLDRALVERLFATAITAPEQFRDAIRVLVLHEAARVPTSEISWADDESAALCAVVLGVGLGARRTQEEDAAIVALADSTARRWASRSEWHEQAMAFVDSLAVESAAWRELRASLGEPEGR